MTKSASSNAAASLPFIALTIAQSEKAAVDLLLHKKSLPNETLRKCESHQNIRIVDVDSVIRSKYNDPTQRKAGSMFEAVKLLEQQNEYRCVILDDIAVAERVADENHLLSKSWLFISDFCNRECRSTLSTATKKQLRTTLPCFSGRIVLPLTNNCSHWQRLTGQICPDNVLFFRNTWSSSEDSPPPINERKVHAILVEPFRSDLKIKGIVRRWRQVRTSTASAELTLMASVFGNGWGLIKKQRVKHTVAGENGISIETPLSESQRIGWLQNTRAVMCWWNDRVNRLTRINELITYAMTGCAIVINRNAFHEQLLGADYPLFATNQNEFFGQLSRLLADDVLNRDAALRVQRAVNRYLFAQKNDPLAFLYHTTDKPTTVLVAGHDLKFFNLLKTKLEETGRYKFIVDQWQGHNRHDAAASEMRIAQADIVFCEWCLGNIEWFSHHKLPHQKLIGRFHSQERKTAYLNRAQIDNIDHISFVSNHIARIGTNKFEIPGHKTSVIPNLIDDERFTLKTKMGGAEYTLGLIGTTPSSKRLDLAIDTLELLLEMDSRYQLRIKGKQPFEYPWLKHLPGETDYYNQLFDRINGNPKLRYKVIFDPHGDDVNEWLTMVGFILSPSDFESFHLAVGEGMLTGCTPVVWNWNGAKELWPEDAIVESAKEAAKRIHAFNTSDEPVPAQENRRFVVERYGITDVVRQWEDILSLPPQPGSK